MDQEEQLRLLISHHADAVLRLSCSYLKNREDAKDVLQTVFLKYLTVHPQLQTFNEERRWLLHVAANVCRDILKSSAHKIVYDLNVCEKVGMHDKYEEGNILSAVNRLDSRYRDVLHLYYYEDYSAEDISKFLQISESTVYTRLSRARALLENILKGGNYEF